MKKVFTLAFALFMCSAAFAQFTNAKSGSRGGNSGGINFGETSYKGFVEAGYAIGLGDMKRNRIDVSTSHGVQFGGHFFAGLGTGVKFFTGAKYYCEVDPNHYGYDFDKGSKGKKSYDIDEKDSFISIPIFADLRANLFEDNSINPFIGLKIGYAIGIEKKKILFEETYYDYFGEYHYEDFCKMKFGGFICTPTIGCRFSINETTGLNVSMGYDIQKANWEIGETETYNGGEPETYSKDGNVAANGLVFKVGIDF